MTDADTVVGTTLQPRHRRRSIVAPDASGGIRARGVRKQFARLGGERVAAVDDVSLDVAPGEFVVLLGPSGCGKTTLLRCLAGLEHPDAGEITLDGRVVYSSEKGIDLPPERRAASMLFQAYALWPHMSVHQNVAYPLRARKISAREVRTLVADALERVGCGHLEEQFPGEISGGQQQRVALARALVADNGVVLFDEPLSNVDAKVRVQLRLELIRLQKRLGFAAVYVTHDQVEALELGDRIAVLDRGRIVQIGTPREVYSTPSSAYVARFLGSINQAPATVTVASERGSELVTAFGRVGSTAHGHAVGDQVQVMFRPEHTELFSAPPQKGDAWGGTVEAALYLGTHCEYVLALNHAEPNATEPDATKPDATKPDVTGSGAPESGTTVVQVRGGLDQDFAEGQQVWISVDPEHVLVFPVDQP